MALRFNNTEITSVYFNGVEKMALQFNGAGYFGKRFTLTKSSSTGVTFTVTRTSSPNQRAATGTISTGNTIYYGDVIKITCTASTGYTNAKLYVNTGSGTEVRTSPYTFTVTGNVTYYGTATRQDDWQTVWSGSQLITSGTEFTVPGLSTSGDEAQLSVNVVFGQWLYDSETFEEKNYMTDIRSISRQGLPTTVYGQYATVSFQRNGNKIEFTATDSLQNMKGYYLYENPVSIEITEVREKK